MTDINMEKAEQSKQKPQRAKKRTVRIVKHIGESAVVEWTEKGYLKRVTIPVSKIEADKVAVSILSAGREYGVPWENVEFQKLVPKNVANTLREEGFWTYDDVPKNPSRVMGIVQKHYQVDVGTLIMFADSSDKKKE